VKRKKDSKEQFVVGKQLTSYARDSLQWIPHSQYD